MFGILETIREIKEEIPRPNTNYQVFNGRWHMNNRTFEELSINERGALVERIKTF
ncbi:hypothetical protein Phi19:3_gp042 [Cellulophaga phage phi19:3]|uniref:Uncharacterized protein n=1 Tax=Cellulophaga phage phi19:3 TaxID=1327971 RepID=R9ZWG3_9CAUD|nr:hypothetical protein Phi19:3_gp042 [Cellulophaga phage phi19:3]AGO47446.1 hypothetical protein Phi19:3_gp042 [Cellulophaga phage phi19:3]